MRRTTVTVARARIGVGPGVALVPSAQIWTDEVPNLKVLLHSANTSHCHAFLASDATRANAKKLNRYRLCASISSCVSRTHSQVPAIRPRSTNN